MNSTGSDAQRVLIYEGKAKKIYSAENSDHVVIEYKNSLTAFNAQKKGQFTGKGMINRDIASLVFRYLKEKGIDSHWISDQGDNEMHVQKLMMIPLEVVVRNVMAGSLSQKLGRPEGEKLSRPMVEFYLKNDELGDPFLSEDQVIILNFADAEDLSQLKSLALKINSHLQELLNSTGFLLVDFKLEFGKNSADEILLGDEISPDSCRLWDLKTQEKYDKDRFRRDLGGVQEAYEEVYRRLKGKV